MPLLAGLGASGMGEVYRARDLTLGRDVAMKLLPDVFVNDPDRRGAELVAASRMTYGSNTSLAQLRVRMLLRPSVFPASEPVEQGDNRHDEDDAPDHEERVSHRFSLRQRTAVRLIGPAPSAGHQVL